MVFLAVVLLIIPATMHTEPLYLWASSSYNTAVFNIIFIALTCSGLVIAIFKKDQTDNTDLNISAKPITKWKMVLAKISIYFMFMIIFIGLSVAMSSLTFTFGVYSANNTNGIKPEQFQSLLLSILVGSAINFLIFGSIAVFISLKGPLIATMLGTTGVALLLTIINFLISRFSPTPRSKLSNDFGLSIETYSLNTASQYFDDSNLEPLSYATIPCNEQNKFDTYEYWTKAMSSSKTEFLNYIDIGKQLSMLYQTFGMEDAQLNSAKHNEIGLSVSYKYQIDQNTDLKINKNIEDKNYPIGCYLIKQDQGQIVPSLNVISHKLIRTLSNNWNFLSKKIGLNFDAINLPSIQENEWLVSPVLIDIFNKKISYSMFELKNNEKQHEASKFLYENALNLFKQSNDFQSSISSTIINDQSGAFFNVGKWDSLSIVERYQVISKIQLNWINIAQEKQINNILLSDSTLSYPFSTSQIVNWYQNNAQSEANPFYYEQKFIENLTTKAIFVGNVSNSTSIYSLISFESVNCETFNNFYQFQVKQYFDTVSITAIYSSIAILLFVISTIVYKRKDIK